MQISKNVYVLSDTTKINKLSNIPSIPLYTPRRSSTVHLVPAFESIQCLTYVKERTQHPYYIVKTHMQTLEQFIPQDSRIAVISTMYCNIDDRRVYFDYETLDIVLDK